MKLLLRIVLVLVGVAVLIYGGDYLALRVPIPPSRAQYDSVTVRPTYDVALKSGKSDLYFLDPQQVTCVNSLFPHFGFEPCWYLRGHTHPQVKM